MITTLSAVKDLTSQGFVRVGPEQWKNNIKHVETKVEDHFWTADNLQEDYVQEFIIAVGMVLDETVMKVMYLKIV